MQEKRQRSW